MFLVIYPQKAKEEDKGNCMREKEEIMEQWSLNTDAAIIYFSF